MRKLLLASVAMAALLAGPAIANAQGASDNQPGGAGAEQHAPKSNAGEDKGKAGQAAQSSPMNEKAKGAGEGQREGMEKQGKSNAAQKSGKSDKKETTGTSEENRQGGKSGTQKSGSSEMKSDEAASPQGAQREGKSSAEKSGKSDKKKQTTGASSGAQSTQSNEQKPGAQPNASSSTQSNQGSTSGQSQPGQTNNAAQGGQSRTGPNAQGHQAGTSSTGSSTSVSQDQQTKFNQVIEKRKVRSVNDANFSVSVGTSVPRSVHVYDMPRDIVTIYPQYRGKKFMVVHDEIVVIEPGTRKIVTVIPRSGRATTGTSTSVTQMPSSKLQLPPEKRRLIRETVIKEQGAPRCSDTQLSVGMEVPRSLQLRPLPDTIVSEVPDIRSYNFCIKDNEVVLIDPSDYRIVEVIE